MEISNISSIYQAKLQEINSKVPNNLSVKDKFSTYLENAKLSSNKIETDTENTVTDVETNKDETDTNKLLTSLLTYQTMSNSTSSLFSSNDSTSNMFPSLNNSWQQSLLMKALQKED